MKTIALIIAVIVGILIPDAAFSQTTTKGEPNPIVPLAVAKNGRKAISENLLMQVDHIVIKYSGRSISGNGWGDQYLDRYLLQILGYTHTGSFTELSSAIYGRAYSGDVVRTPDGNYEVNAQLTYYTSDNRVVLRGSGYLPIYDDGINLIVGTFEPYVDINYYFDVVIPGYVTGARWTGINGRSLNFVPSYDGQNTTITCNSGNMDNGFLLLTDSVGHITGWDLATGDSLSGKRIYAILGATHSSAFQSLVNPNNIDNLGLQFYQWNDEVLGRYPLLDVTTTKSMTKAIWFTVPIWGSSQLIAPSHVFVKYLYFNGPSNGLEINKEYEIPFSSSAGGYIPNIPANCGLHMRIEFDRVSDLDEQSDGGYSVGIGKGKE